MASHCLGRVCNTFSAALSHPTFCPTAYANNPETMAKIKNGAHHAALRRRSVKVLEGAIKVSMIRTPSESGAGPGAGVGTDIGGSGAAAMKCLLVKTSRPF